MLCNNMVLQNPVSELQVQLASLEMLVDYVVDELKIDLGKFNSKLSKELQHQCVSKKHKVTKTIATQT